MSGPPEEPKEVADARKANAEERKQLAKSAERILREQAGEFYVPSPAERGVT